MAVVANIVRSSISRGSDGTRHSVVYFITASSLKAALDQMPAHGTPSSEFPGLFALEFNVEHAAEQPQQYWGTTVYRRPDPFSTEDDPPDPTPSGGTISVGSRLQPATFTKDAGDNQIITTHTFNEPAPGRSGTDTQPGEVAGFRPTTVLSVTRTENDSPQALAIAFVGKTNAGNFFGEGSGSWLCTAIEGFSEDQGATYTVTYEFELSSDPDLWNATVAYIDDKTGRPVLPLVDGVSRRTYQIYEQTSFSGLDLD